jgi:hypothetical protein
VAGARESGRCLVARWEDAEDRFLWVSEKARETEVKSGWVVERQLEVGAAKATEAEKPRRASARFGMKYSPVEYGLSHSTRPWGRG